MAGKKGIKGSKSEEIVFSSTSEECVNTMGIKGFSTKCLCGCERSIYNSKTMRNPGRPFYRCPTFRKEHLFKWVEDAILEEVEDALPKIGSIESEIHRGKEELEAIKDVVMGLKDVKRCKVMLKICLGLIFLIMIVGVV